MVETNLSVNKIKELYSLANDLRLRGVNEIGLFYQRDMRILGFMLF